MIEGVLVVDKPAGIGSTDVVRAVRKAAGQRRVGHTGTLDPTATGVLVVCLGRATRLVRFLQAGSKTYRAEMVLGRETTTQDASGDVVAQRSAADVTEQALCDVFKRFVGDIDQVPPMVSAVRVDGERLYDKARRGEHVERDARRVSIDEIVLESFQPASVPEGGRRDVTRDAPDESLAHASFLVTCSSGTYVRTLAHDIGRVLKCGASLTALRRYANGGFTVDDAHDLDEITGRGRDDSLDEIVLSMAEAVRDLARRRLDREEAVDVSHGRTLAPSGQRDPVALIYDDRLAAVYADDDGRARAEVVFIQPEDLADDPAADELAAGTHR